VCVCEDELEQYLNNLLSQTRMVQESTCVCACCVCCVVCVCVCVVCGCSYICARIRAGEC
jgi:hypothetical protein